MDFIKRFFKKGNGSKSAKGNLGEKVSEEGKTVFAFKAHAPAAASLAVFQRVVSISSKAELVVRIRREAHSPDADVIILEAEEWDAPNPASLSQSDLATIYPRVVQKAAETLSKGFGAGNLSPMWWRDHGAGAMPHPTGHVLFLFVMPGRYTRDQTE